MEFNQSKPFFPSPSSKVKRKLGSKYEYPVLGEDLGFLLQRPQFSLVSQEQYTLMKQRINECS